MSDQGTLSIEDAARFLRISVDTVSEYAARNEIPHSISNGKFLFKQEQIKRWVEEQLENNASLLPEHIILDKILHKSRIKIIENVSQKEDAINILASCFLDVPGIKDKQELVEALLYRERLMSTGIGLGVAVPHVRLPDVKSLFLGVGVSRNDITDYDSIDNKPVRIIMMVIAGKGQHQDYIRLLGYLSLIVKNSIARDRLITSDSIDQVFNILTNRTV
ncbi:MAG: PTS sugar transporter subunit IIA [Chitinispirillaceae bacterium]|nr:PTS sugar transporter subunit IIA [Chitinispirillaceae bacterium]